MPPYHERTRPVHRVLAAPDARPIVFVTVCTERRAPWLADAAVHRDLIAAWCVADAWAVGRYVLMPDHLHLFASPTRDGAGLDAWVRYWKSTFTRLHRNPTHRWQAGYWDRALRDALGYEAKWEYVRANPMRHGLVERPDDWRFQGEMVSLSK